MASFLDLPFTPLEIKEALFQMEPTKALELDGMPALFFRKYRHIVGDDITRAAFNILDGNDSLYSYIYSAGP